MNVREGNGKVDRQSGMIR